jgi:pyruvate dehydrogenase E2 component (dihydrolipoamide acetyltransferase)
MSDFRMPILGAEMESGRLVEWRVRPGDRVKRGDIVAVVDTDKAAIEVEIFEDAVVEALLIQPGERVAVGTVLARLRGGEGTAGPAVAPGAVMVAPATAGPGLLPAAARLAPPAPAASAPARSRAARTRPVSPAARRLAEERGCDLSAVEGTGLDGAITRADVERALAAAPSLAASPPAPAATGSAPTPPADRQAAMRRAIAAAMARSKREIPHYYLERTVVMDHALMWLESQNARRPIAERLLPFVLQIKAAALAVSAAPEMNGQWRDGAFCPSAAVHAGVAIALRPAGLVAPALRDVERKPVDQLMREFTDLMLRARAGSLRSSELADPTLTVNGLGDRGADVVYGVIYPPQVAMIGFGRVHEAAWSEHGALLSRNVCRVSLAADHRVSDGHRGSLYLEALDLLLQTPERW